MLKPIKQKCKSSNLDHLAYHPQDSQLLRSPSVVQHAITNHCPDPNRTPPYGQTIAGQMKIEKRFKLKTEIRMIVKKYSLCRLLSGSLPSELTY